MFMKKENRKHIYTKLFSDGVMVAEKNFNAPTHPELTDETNKVTNLEVIKACQSLASRGLVKEQFAWRHFYWYLTDEGVDYLREYLHLPAEVVPDTQQKKAVQRETRGGRPERRTGGFRGGDDGYRRGGDKLSGAPGGFDPQFRGGYGRGSAM